MVHRESDKFIIANEAPHDQKLAKSGIFDCYEDGEPEVFQKSFHNVKGLNDNRKSYFPRKEEVQEILYFFKDSTQRLIVCGPAGISRVPTIAKAVRYAVEHDFEACQDGAYFLDLNEAHTIQEVYQMFIEALNLTI